MDTKQKGHKGDPGHQSRPGANWTSARPRCQHSETFLFWQEICASFSNEIPRQSKGKERGGKGREGGGSIPIRMEAPKASVAPPITNFTHHSYLMPIWVHTAGSALRETQFPLDFRLPALLPRPAIDLCSSTHGHCCELNCVSQKSGFLS